MESRKAYYKNKPVGTLSERVKKDRVRQNMTRNFKFNANRNIDLNDTTSPDKKPSPQKLSNVRDKSARLKKYIEQKRTAKLKEKIEERAPFIPYVPVGRWLEKSEPLPKPKAFVINTPIRKALMKDEKILKKSTIKEIALAATTAKKENAGTFQNKKDIEVKSRRKILGDKNSADNLPAKNHKEKFVIEKEKSITTIEDDEQKSSLNETFELITHDLVLDDSVFERPTEEISNENKEPTKVIVKSTEEENKIVTSNNIKQATQKPKRGKAKIVVPVQRKPIEKNVSKSTSMVTQKSDKTKKKHSPKNKSPVIIQVKSPQIAPSQSVVTKKIYSNTYKFYTSALENQVAFITFEVRDIAADVNAFIANLSDDTQALVHQTLQQADLLVKEKFKSFEDVLMKFEKSEVTDPKKVTEDDVENYWVLLYEQINNFKENLNFIREAKSAADKQNRKRRTTRVHLLVDATPSRRSMRIAVKGDTPKHSASCFGCTPVSSSKVNTPKSIKSSVKRRTAFKRSIAFDQQ
ncbi:hypothetical protein PVAND_002010 [Polypedilum vanderplanki]|uniref:Uncharacterized protein n=1 Tax=Polypedilum vanderplanki TaxID=319348 RepID=A0A9J6BPP8_POLVA|nr:hypothetical protein PVAND_002010 [Polypedilum vanderplanki]